MFSNHVATGDPALCIGASLMLIIDPHSLNIKITFDHQLFLASPNALEVMSINQSIFILQNNPLGFSNRRRLDRATDKFVHHSNVTL